MTTLIESYYNSGKFASMFSNTKLYLREAYLYQYLKDGQSQIWVL